jgi:LemA protein
MRAGQILLAIFVVLIVAALMSGGCIYRGYNQVVTLDEAVKQQWADVDTRLQERHDLIDNLVSTVKGTALQEQKVFGALAEARKDYIKSKAANDASGQAEAENRIDSALVRVLSLSEAYPELRSNESFLKLQDSLEGTEHRISVERRKYNNAVQQLNAFMRRFPGPLYASLAGVHEAAYFKPDEAARTAPKVDFSDKTDKAKS